MPSHPRTGVRAFVRSDSIRSDKGLDMRVIVYSTSSDGLRTPVGSDRTWRDEAMARGIAAGFAPEQVDAVLKRYRAV